MGKMQPEKGMGRRERARKEQGGQEGKEQTTNKPQSIWEDKEAEAKLIYVQFHFDIDSCLPKDEADGGALPPPPPAEPVVDTPMAPPPPPEVRAYVTAFALISCSSLACCPSL